LLHKDRVSVSCRSARVKIWATNESISRMASGKFSRACEEIVMLNDLRYRLRALFRRDAMESELDQELRFHFENAVEKYVRSGMTEEAARRRAKLAFGGDTQIKQECRDARGTG